MKKDFADIYLYSIVGSFILFIVGSVLNFIEVAVIGLLLVVGLLLTIIVFGMKDFGLFDRTGPRCVDLPVDPPRDTIIEREIIHHYHPVPSDVCLGECVEEPIDEVSEYYNDPGPWF